jgi:V/A-type H+-transporting ATPase subunit G/H
MASRGSTRDLGKRGTRRGFALAEDLIRKVKEAEQQALNILREAEAKASRVVEESGQKSKDRIEEAKRAASRLVEQALEEASREAQEEIGRIKAQEKTGMEALRARAVQHMDEAVDSIFRGIQVQ